MSGYLRFYFQDFDTPLNGMFAHGASAYIIENGARKLINGHPCRKSILGFSDRTKSDVVITCETIGATEPVLIKDWRAEEMPEYFYLIP